MATRHASPTLGPLFLVTRRIDEMARFYDEVVGLRETSREAGHSVWYDVGGHDFALHELRLEPGPEFTPKEGPLIWFTSKDVDLEAAVDRLRTLGASQWGPFAAGPRELLYALDPDGNAVGIAREFRIA